LKLEIKSVDTTQPSIVQLAKKWYVSGDVLMDNANFVLSQSATFAMEHEVEIDFDDVGNVDTAALSLMLEWQRLATLSNCKLTFVKVPASLTSLANLYGVEDFISLNAK
jgi:phospholipid transport system transporter-binding protein